MAPRFVLIIGQADRFSVASRFRTISDIRKLEVASTEQLITGSADGEDTAMAACTFDLRMEHVWNSARVFTNRKFMRSRLSRRQYRSIPMTRPWRWAIVWCTEDLSLLAPTHHSTRL